MGFVIPACRRPVPDDYPVFPRRTRRSWFKMSADPCSEFGPFLESSLVQPSCPPNLDDSTIQRLSWAPVPYSTCKLTGSTHAGFAFPLCSVPRVWRPSRRFTPPKAGPVVFHTGSAHGISPSELTPPARYPRRFRSEAPTYRFSRRCSLPPRRRAGPSGRGSWALALARSPLTCSAV